MSNELMNINPTQSFAYIEKLGDYAFKSRLFKSIDSVANAIVKIQAGIEYGLTPMRALSSLYVVNGNVAMMATLIAARVRASGRYEYRIMEHTNEVCRIAFFSIDMKSGAAAPLGDSVFTIQDAQMAGLLTKDVWKSYPRNMLFSRAMANGQRWFCPDLFDGPVYTPEEMNMAVNGDGMVIEDAVVRTPDRNEWHRKAALALYPHLDETAKAKIMEVGNDVDVSSDDFDAYLVDVAWVHAVRLPDHPTWPNIDPLRGPIPANVVVVEKPAEEVAAIVADAGAKVLETLSQGEEEPVKAPEYEMPPALAEQAKKEKALREAAERGTAK